MKPAGNSLTSPQVYFSGGGEMGEMIRKFPWAETPMGSPGQWPQGLIALVNVLINSKFPMFVWWGREMITIYNDAYKIILGDKHPNALGNSGPVVWKEIWDVVGPLAATVMQKGVATWSEDQLLYIKRQEVVEETYFTFSYSPVFDDEGKVGGVFCACTETTEKVIATRRIKESEEKARMAIDAADLGTFELNYETDQVHTSPRFNQIFGLSGTTDHANFIAALHPDDLSARQQAYDMARKTGFLHYDARVYDHQQQTYKWVSLSGRVLFDEEKKPRRMTGVIQDISEQKTFAEELSKQVKQRTSQLEDAQQSLLASYQYLQRIINIVNSPLQVLEPVFENGQVVDFIYKLTNEAYAAYANTAPENLKDKKVSDFFPGYFQTDSFKKIRETYNSGKAEIWENHYAADGLNIFNQMNATPMDNEVVVYFTDFTSLKNLQLELEKKVIELERSNRNLEDFAYAASHDLKEPIRKIHFFADRLKSQIHEMLNPEQLNLFKKLELATQRMGSLIDDLLTYSQVSITPIAMEEVDLNELVKAVQADLELEIEEKNATLQVSQLPHIKGYPRQLQQLFQNLLTNALKYKSEKRPLQISISSRQVSGADLPVALSTEEKNKKYYQVSVADNGIGFNQEDAEIIFDVFKRLHSAIEYRGTGVGLSIVRKVVQHHQGYIWAEGESDKGAIFHIILPAS